MDNPFERPHHALVEEEGPSVRSRHPSFINQRVWPAISTGIVMLVIQRFFMNFQKWRSGYELLVFSIIFAVVWFKVFYPLVMWRWGEIDDLGYGWLEAWNNGVDFISTAVLFFVATLTVNIVAEELDIHGFTTLEGLVMTLIGVVLLYGGYVYIIRISEAKFYFEENTRIDDEEAQNA